MITENEDTRNSNIEQMKMHKTNTKTNDSPQWEAGVGDTNLKCYWLDLNQQRYIQDI